MRRLPISLLLALVAFTTAWADTWRPVTSTFTYAVGSGHVTDTYLAPMRHSGWSMALGYERWQAMAFNPEAWVQNLQTTLNVWDTRNPARNITMWYGAADIQWSMMRRWRLSSVGGVTAGIGPMTALSLGIVYNTVNGNNPVAAKASWVVGAEGYLARSFTLGRTQIDARYVTSLPVTGVFFAPQYAELYYEIYLGDHRDLAHWAHWGNYFGWDNAVTADIHLGGTILTVGYRQHLLSTHVSHITSRLSSHAFVIGLGGEWISLRPRHEVSPDTQIISATY